MRHAVLGGCEFLLFALGFLLLWSRIRCARWRRAMGTVVEIRPPTIADACGTEVIRFVADGKEVTVPFQQCDNDLDSEWTPRYSVGEEVPVRFPHDRPEEALPEEDACPGPWEPWLVLLFGGGLSGAS